MLICDTRHNYENPIESQALEAYLKGVFDSAPRDFKEEDHPRGRKGSKEGGRFIKSEKTKRKEDEVDNLEDYYIKFNDENREKYFRQSRSIAKLMGLTDEQVEKVVSLEEKIRDYQVDYYAIEDSLSAEENKCLQLLLGEEFLLVSSLDSEFLKKKWEEEKKVLFGEGWEEEKRRKYGAKKKKT